LKPPEPFVLDDLRFALDQLVIQYIEQERILSLSQPPSVDSRHQHQRSASKCLSALSSIPTSSKVPSQIFDANHTAFLIKLLAHNVLRRYARHVAAPRTWPLPWIRRALFLVPGRLVCSGRQSTLRLPPRTSLLLAAARLE
jgi:hypothetical protein